MDFWEGANKFGKGLISFISMKTIKGFILAIAFIVTPVVFVGIYLFTSFVCENLFVKHTQKISKAISEQVFNSMYRVMREGWTREEVEEFLKSTEKVFKETPYRVDIYRGEIVEELFGKIKQKEMDHTIMKSFRTGREIDLYLENIIRNIYPIRAKGECLGCHDNAKEGDMLGVFDVRQNLSPPILEARRRFLFYFLMMMPIPLIGSFLLSNFIIKRINSSIDMFHQKVEGINRVRDLKTIRMEEMDMGFTELTNLFGEIKRLISRVKEIAIDSDVLEFEVRFLEKFIITAEVIEDWKRHVNQILMDMNNIIKISSIVSLFHIEEKTYDLEIFWLNTPSPDTKDRLVRTIKERIKEIHYFGDVKSIRIIDNIIDPSKSLPELSEEDTRLQTKTLFLETPKIGEIIGIGVQGELSDEPTSSLAIEAILTTLLNVVGSVRAIYKYTRDLEYYATRDPLTELYNRRIFWEMLNYEIMRSKRRDYKFSLLITDIDNFKVINDTFGHSFGDKILQEHAVIMRGGLRGEDILGRYGGDEFIAILPETNGKQAYLVATRLKDCIDNFSLPTPEGRMVKTTVSIGIVTYPDHAADSKDLFLVADNMLYKAKARGKDRIVVPMEEDIVEVFKKLGEKSIVIMNALEEKRIVPYFQPILNLKSKEIEDYEVLMRIQTPERILSANEFIDIAEETGIIFKLDYLLIEKAFEEVKDYKFDHLFLNLSPRALMFSKFIPEVRQLAGDYGIDPSRVVFELTERDTVKGMTLLERFVLDLKFEGFNFAIDDFGSGFSSFHYIRRFPIDFLKVEGEFIRGMVKDNRDKAFVLSISTLAKEMGIRTIAEFVEDEATLKAVEMAGINYAQGYYIGRPGPGESILGSSSSGSKSE